MKSTLLYLTALLGISVFIGCKKDSGGDNNPPPETCTLDRAFYYDDANAVVDTSGFVYTGTQLTTVNLQDYFINLEYTGNNITRKNYFEYGTPSSSLGHDAFTYNGDNTVSSAEFYYTDASLPSPVIYDRIELTYSGGKLVKLIDKYDTSSTGNQPLVPILEYNYTYTGNNITQVIIKDLIGSEADTVNYEYDANTNHYSKIPHALYTDQLFTQFDGVLLPFVLSANNITRLSSSSGSTVISYNLDAKNNLSELLAAGARVARYTYKCQ